MKEITIEKNMESEIIELIERFSQNKQKTIEETMNLLLIKEKTKNAASFTTKSVQSIIGTLNIADDYHKIKDELATDQVAKYENIR
jgi:hypothetical protein